MHGDLGTVGPFVAVQRERMGRRNSGQQQKSDTTIRREARHASNEEVNRGEKAGGVTQGWDIFLREKGQLRQADRLGTVRNTLRTESRSGGFLRSVHQAAPGNKKPQASHGRLRLSG